ncbi:MAG TPA: hypothetical protein VIO61_02875 [Anaerolineaceae bacterium]
MAKLSSYLWYLKIGLRSWGKNSAPDETSFRRGILVASAFPDKVERAIGSLQKRFPEMDLTVITTIPQLAADFSKINGARVNLVDLASSAAIRQVIDSLTAAKFDVCFTMLTGDGGYKRLKTVGLLSGARYIRIIDENEREFYWMLNSLPRIIIHSMRRLILHYGSAALFFGLTLIGYLVTLIRVVPYLMNAARMRRSPNPFKQPKNTE